MKRRWAAVARCHASLARKTSADLVRQGVAKNLIRIEVRLRIRYAGTDTPLEIAYKPGRKVRLLQLAFERAHKAHFGFIDRTRSLVLEAMDAEASGWRRCLSRTLQKATIHPLPKPVRQTRLYSCGRWRKAVVYMREQLLPGHEVQGPSLLIEPHQTIVIENGWCAQVTLRNQIVLSREKAVPRVRAIGTKADPVLLEVFNNRFISIAEQMGPYAVKHSEFGQQSKRGSILLRHIRRERQSCRQCAAYSRSSRLNG